MVTRPTQTTLNTQYWTQFKTTVSPGTLETRQSMKQFGIEIVALSVEAD